MLAFLVRRAIYSVVVVVGVSVVVFIVTHMIGDPAKLMLPLNASHEEYLRLRQSLGLDDPIWVQFGRFAGAALQGDFGVSIWQRIPAMQLVLERLPATFLLTFTAMVIALALAIPLGIIAALKPGSAVDKVATVVSLFGVSVPNFWLAMVLILVFAVNLGWFYTSGYGSIQHLILPCLTLAALSGGRVTQIVRSAMIDELSKQYIVTARSKGVAEQVIFRKHALRNAAIPVITLSGWELVRMLAGYTVPVEIVFAWPGVGQLAMQAIIRHDLPVIQADVFVVALMVVAINTLVDISYTIVDPRVRLR
jgi:peptide/nickel transport system permease protein